MKNLILCFVMMFAGQTFGYSDWNRVQDRLKLIESLLSSRPLPGWPQERTENRKVSLKYLREYWEANRFPVNSTRPEGRHPIFKDADGTLCAVGYIMHRWGYENAVKRIHKTQNEAYIEEIQDPDLNEFVEKSGLEVEELKLIQPAYAPQDLMLDQIRTHDWAALQKHLKEQKGARVLFLAVYLRELEVVKWVLESGIDPNLKVEERISLGEGGSLGGGWPLEMAAAVRSLEIIRLLLQHGAKVSNGLPVEALMNPIRMTSRGGADGNLDTKYFLDMLQAISQPGAKASFDLNVLQLTGCSSAENLKLLEQRGLDLNKKDYFSALSRCLSIKSSPDAIEYLLRKGNPPIESGGGGQVIYHSPIHIVMEKRRIELLEVFDKYLPLRSVKLDSWETRDWYESGASLAGYAALRGYSDMFEKLLALGVKLTDEDVVWAATVKNGLYKRTKDLNKQGYEKNKIRLMKIFTETCQVQNLKETLKDMSEKLRTEVEKTAIRSRGGCQEGVQLVLKKFPKIKVE